MAGPDITTVQSQLRLASYRLAQFQERHDQTSNVTKRDVASLISKHDITLARKKVEKLVQEDRLSSMLEKLEANCNLLLERLSELGRQSDLDAPSPLLEAVSMLLIVCPHTEIKDIAVLHDSLLQVYGTDFAQRLVRKYASRVPPQIFDAIDRRPPTADEIDVYMTSIVSEYHLAWTPPQLVHQRARILSEALDHNSATRVVDLQTIRRICSRGIPPQPAWLRPRIWKLLFGMLSAHKDSWQGDLHVKRWSYYDLARSLLSRLKASPSPSTPLSQSDTALLNMARALSNLPSELDTDSEPSPLCPLGEEAPDGLRIEEATAVEDRLRTIQRHVHGLTRPDVPPEIQVEYAEGSVFPPSSQPFNQASEPSLVLIRGHASALIRIMYIHISLHSAASTAYLSSVLIPLYVALLQEVEPADLAHIEADTFWLCSELWGEVSDLMQADGSRQWIVKFGEKLASTDWSLYQDLTIKGLNPTLPHYSHRWMASLLTRTLPLHSVLTIWDGLFSQESLKTNENPKLEFLLDICTGMLINARARLFRLGKSPLKIGLWSEVDPISPSRSTTPVAFDNAFVQGIAFLQEYPILEVGGAERVLELAVDLKEQRENAKVNTSQTSKLGERFLGTVSDFISKTPSISVTKAEPEEEESDGTPSPEWPDSDDEGEDVTVRPGALQRLGTTVWRGLTNQSSMDPPPSPLPPPSPTSPRGRSSLNPPETPPPRFASQASQLSSKIGNTLWRGFSNQSAMDPPHSPTSPLPPTPTSDQSSRAPSILWTYTERFKNSNTAATLSKTGTNLSIRASSLWGKPNSPPESNPPGSTVSSPGYETPQRFRSQSGDFREQISAYTFPRRGSVPTHYGDGQGEEYVPPPRPNFRESRFFSPQEDHSASNSPSTSRASSPPLLAKTKSTIMSLTGVSKPTPRSGPRPLLLSSSSLITPSQPRRNVVYPPSSTLSGRHRDSVSSVSSAVSSTVSPIVRGTRSSVQSDRDSDASGSRIVPIRGRYVRQHSYTRSSAGDRSPSISAGSHTLPEVDAVPKPGAERRESSESRGSWTQVVKSHDSLSPSSLPSSSPPVTPGFAKHASITHESRMADSASNRLSDPTELPWEEEKKLGSKRSPSLPSPISPHADAPLESSTQTHGPLLRSKRYVGRTGGLRTKRAETGDRKPSGSLFISTDTLEPTSAEHSYSEGAAVTPRAADFILSSPESQPRTRKNSRTNRDLRESEGEEGDDEAYSDFLSAYESEDGTNTYTAANA